MIYIQGKETTKKERRKNKKERINTLTLDYAYSNIKLNNKAKTNHSHWIVKKPKNQRRSD